MEESSNPCSAQRLHMIDRADIQQWLTALTILGAILMTIGYCNLRGRETEFASDPRRPIFQLDLNDASVAELSLLPQIGPVLAGRIVAERATGGNFLSVDDVQRTPGIGPARVERIRQYVDVDPPNKLVKNLVAASP